MTDTADKQFSIKTLFISRLKAIQTKLIIYVLKGKTKFYTHTPFVSDFINKVLHAKQQLPYFIAIEKLRNELLQNNSIVRFDNLESEIKMGFSRESKINEIAKRASTPTRFGQLFSYIVDHYQCNTIIEIGTCLGMGTAYLASANSNAKVITLEGIKARALVAEKNFEQLQLKNIEVIIGNFSDTLPVAVDKFSTIDLAFIDGSHGYQQTISYFHQISSKINNDSILIFDDIRWSKEMYQTWKEIIKHPKVTVTIDLFRLGIVFFRKEQAKENVSLYF